MFLPIMCNFGYSFIVTAVPFKLPENSRLAWFFSLLYFCAYFSVAGNQAESFKGNFTYYLIERIF
jgi:hypothetical protein